MKQTESVREAGMWCVYNPEDCNPREQGSGSLWGLCSFPCWIILVVLVFPVCVTDTVLWKSLCPFHDFLVFCIFVSEPTLISDKDNLSKYGDDLEHQTL